MNKFSVSEYSDNNRDAFLFKVFFLFWTTNRGMCKEKFYYEWKNSAYGTEIC